jgi:ABC-type Fe3+/spermidine/putrescine transport system ATPase subunit
VSSVLANPRPLDAATHEVLLEVRGVAKRFGTRDVLKSISLSIASGEFLTLLGESGSGKTTLLRLIAGFEQPTAGEIWMSGERLDALPPYKRVKSTPASEISGRVDHALRMVKMEEFAASRPSKLSGGQQQRVALARALVNRPQLLLLDEPLSALDANLRKQMQGELKTLQRELGITFLFVTHDQEEAMALSDRIALLRGGALEQVASAREIYAHPATAYTAQFIGQTNLLRAEVRNGLAVCGTLQWPAEDKSGTAVFSLRPEAIQLASASIPIPGTVHFRAAVRQQFYSGASEMLEVSCAGGQLLRVRVPAQGPLSGEHEFVFSVADAIRVQE